MVHEIFDNVQDFSKKLFLIFEICSGFLKNLHDFLKVVYEF
jgi:hypothetical protein